MVCFRVAVLPLLVTAGGSTAFSATIWGDGGQDSSWSDALNWSSGVPDNTQNGAPAIGTQPTGNLVGLDTGVELNEIYSLAFNATLSNSVEILPAGIEQLVIDTSVTNSSTKSMKFSLPVSTSSTDSATVNYITGGGLIFNNALTLGTHSINVSGIGGIVLGTLAPTTIGVGSTTLYGGFSGSGTVNYNTTDLQFDFDFDPTGLTRSSWDFFGSISGSVDSVSFVGNNLNGSLTEMTAGSWSGIVDGRTWTYTESTGVLLLVPEPSSAAFLITGALFASAWRRRK